MTKTARYPALCALIRLGIICLGIICLDLGAAPSAWANGPEAICLATVIPGLARSTHGDGLHEAWRFQYRFGRLALETETHPGAAPAYRLSLDHQALPPLQPPLGKPVLACLRAKGIATTKWASEPCGGERFKLVIARAADRRNLFLFERNGGGWRLCRAYAGPP